MKENTSKKRKWAVVFLVLSLVFLFFTAPSRSPGYVTGYLLAKIVPWSLILGIISYFIWLGAHKRKGLFLFAFSLLFLLAATFELAGIILKGYIDAKYLKNLPTLFNEYGEKSVPAEE